MSYRDAFFSILKSDNCPLYNDGDEFKISGISLSVPIGKPACLTLIGDMEIFLKCESLEDSFLASDEGDTLDCSGCTGKIRMTYRKSPVSGLVKKTGKDFTSTITVLSKFAFFQTFGEDNIKDLVSSLKLLKFDPESTVIRKGDPGKNLYIIISGKVDVMGDEGISIATLGTGELFGEMSLLSGDPVGATIKVIEPSKILSLEGEYFRKVLNKHPSLQMFIARQLARRLAQSNIAITTEFSSGIIGKLSEMLPSVLFQTMNLNQKTGVLIFDLPNGPAKVWFRSGEIIGAEYGNKTGEKAFYDLLRADEGRFRFNPILPKEKENAEPMGDFMGILMEGVKRIDEGQ